MFKKGGTVTPANACPMNDGAAGMLVSTAETAEQFGFKPMGSILGYAYTGVDPAYMGIGPADGAAEGAQAGTGSSTTRLDLVEINEAFAAQVLAWRKDAGRRPWLGLGQDQRQWRRDCARPSGRRVGLTHRGDPVARDEAPQRPLRPATLCVGGGQGARLWSRGLERNQVRAAHGVAATWFLDGLV